MKKKCIECQELFEFKTHNQKYCSNQCCRVSTNKRIMQKYYEKRARLKGAVRNCDCGDSLSRYNPESICTKCFNATKKSGKTEALGVLKDVSSITKKTTS